MTEGSSTGTSERELRDTGKGGEKKKTGKSRKEINKAKRANKHENKKRKAAAKQQGKMVEEHNRTSGSDSDSGSESEGNRSPPAKKRKQGTTSHKKQEDYKKQLQRAEQVAPQVPEAMLENALQSGDDPVTTAILVKGADLEWFTANNAVGHTLLGVGAGGSGIDSKQGVDGKKSKFTKKQCAMAIKAWNAIAKGAVGLKSGIMPPLKSYSPTHELPEGAQEFFGEVIWSTIGSRNKGGRQETVSKVLERIATTPLREVSTDICLTFLYSVDHLFDTFVFWWWRHHHIAFV